MYIRYINNSVNFTPIYRNITYMQVKSLKLVSSSSNTKSLVPDKYKVYLNVLCGVSNHFYVYRHHCVVSYHIRRLVEKQFSHVSQKYKCIKIIVCFNDGSVARKNGQLLLFYYLLL